MGNVAARAERFREMHRADVRRLLYLLLAKGQQVTAEHVEAEVAFGEARGRRAEALKQKRTALQRTAALGAQLSSIQSMLTELGGEPEVS